ncbi:hypothetical protein AAHN93_03465 [Vandammella animalimorsus]|uniref:hypothetical protein n=1 Tax=Vandammella animalimorsus TaxID=2029117 RepID=UPI0031BAB3DA
MVQCKKVVYVCLRYPMMGQRRATEVCTMPRALAVLRRTWGCWRLGLRSGFRGKSRRCKGESACKVYSLARIFNAAAAQSWPENAAAMFNLNTSMRSLQSKRRAKRKQIVRIR